MLSQAVFSIILRFSGLLFVYSNDIQPIFQEKAYMEGKGSSSSSHLWPAQLSIVSFCLCNHDDVPWFTEKITLQSVTVKVSGFVSRLENSHLVLPLTN